MKRFTTNRIVILVALSLESISYGFDIFDDISIEKEHNLMSKYLDFEGAFFMEQ